MDHHNIDATITWGNNHSFSLLLEDGLEVGFTAEGGSTEYGKEGTCCSDESKPSCEVWELLSPFLVDDVPV